MNIDLLEKYALHSFCGFYQSCFYIMYIQVSANTDTTKNGQYLPIPTLVHVTNLKFD